MGRGDKDKLKMKKGEKKIKKGEKKLRVDKKEEKKKGSCEEREDRKE